jgi:membrane-bound metal-dependent hydrolase YbcI (DUF457 family)
MNGNGHGILGLIISGVAGYTAYKFGSKPIDIFGLTASVMVFSFYPDIDAEFSTIRSKAKLLSAVYSWIQKLAKRNGVTNNIFKHRGALFHSIWTILPFVVLYYYSNFLPFLGAILGILGHHFLDSLTPKGLRWLYPMRRRRDK